MVTLAQLKEFLASFGITIPDFILAQIVEKVSGTEACMVGAGYSDADILLISTYCAAALAISASGRVVTSQSAPSGASQSFKTNDALLSQMRSMIDSLDSTGCTDALIATTYGKTFLSFSVDRG